MRFGNFNFGMTDAFSDLSAKKDERRPGRPQWAEGNWWLRAAEFGQIRRHALKYNCSLSQAVSDLCMVPASFSNRALYAVFRVNALIPAYTGVGRAVNGSDEHGNAVHIRPRCDQPVEQLFIPRRFLTNLECIRQFSSVASVRTLRSR